MIKHVAFLILTHIVFVQAFSCSCNPRKTVKDEFQESVVVIKGRVLRIDTAFVVQKNVYEALIKDSTESYSSTLFLMSTTLEVERVYKGKKIKRKFSVMSGQAEWTATCGFPFIVGETYIVYAYRQPGYLLDTNREEEIVASTGNFSRVPPVFKDELFETSYCTRTTVFNVKEDLQLRSVARQRR